MILLSRSATPRGNRKMIWIFLLSGIMSSCVSASVVTATVGAGENITVHCDCALSVGAFVVWYRNCSHVYQPSLALRLELEPEYLPNKSKEAWTSPLPGFHFVRNDTSNSYDLLITNVSESVEGVYFCGTVTSTLVEQNCLVQSEKYAYGKASTRIMIKSPQNTDDPQFCDGCWTWLFSLCPAFALSSFVLALVLVYVVWLKKDPHTEDTEARIGQHEEEDVCYAALEVHHLAQRHSSLKNTRRNKHCSDFSTYSAVKTSTARL